jgi:hypothetical protein
MSEAPLSEGDRKALALALEALAADAGPADLAEALRAGRVRIWMGEGAVLATELAAEPDGPCLHVWLAAGRLSQVLALRPGLEAWARGAGCARITLDGRKGWARVLAPFGYRRAGHEIERRL